MEGVIGTAEEALVTSCKKRPSRTNRASTVLRVYPIQS